MLVLEFRGHITHFDTGKVDHPAKKEYMEISIVSPDSRLSEEQSGKDSPPN